MLAGGGSGVALDFAQQLVPGREFEIPDMFINGAGTLPVSQSVSLAAVSSSRV